MKDKLKLGQRFSHLKIEKLEPRKITLRCDCGNETTVTTRYYLEDGCKSGKRKSCGCKRNESKLKDKTGQTIGGAYVECRIENDASNVPKYKCICKCGNEFERNSQSLAKSLKSGKTQTCIPCTRERIKHSISKKFKFNHTMMTLKQISSVSGLPINTLRTRMAAGDSLKQAVKKTHRITSRMVKVMVRSRYGKLTVISEAVKSGASKMWNCKCDCGEKRVVGDQYLKNGSVRSCKKCSYNNRKPKLSLAGFEMTVDELSNLTKLSKSCLMHRAKAGANLVSLNRQIINGRKTT